jgi:antitoxin (DNA-binding transcriptional repressor) of toxin-antitoxin stability system
MARSGYNDLMATEVRIAELKNNLSRYLRAAQKGVEIVVKDRDTPIARISGYRRPRIPLQVRPAEGSPADIKALVDDFYAKHPNITRVKPEDLEEALRWNKRDAFDKMFES